MHKASADEESARMGSQREARIRIHRDPFRRLQLSTNPALKQNRFRNAHQLRVRSHRGLYAPCSPCAPCSHCTLDISIHCPRFSCRRGFLFGSVGRALDARSDAPRALDTAGY